ncbi:hypothetical protein V8E53_004812 [Lactarius tabidus]
MVCTCQCLFVFFRVAVFRDLPLPLTRLYIPLYSWTPWTTDLPFHEFHAMYIYGVSVITPWTFTAFIFFSLNQSRSNINVKCALLGDFRYWRVHFACSELLAPYPSSVFFIVPRRE